MKHWIEAARLRTLPLSISGIITGSSFAEFKIGNQLFNWGIFSFAIITTLGLQILSNFANDYGDGVKGTDNNQRIGPKRAIQSGVISPKAMKKAIIITSIITLISIIILIYIAFEDTNLEYSITYLFLGSFAVLAAIFYTVGKKAYGYSGFGDLFVFLFFGIVSTIGVYFLYTKKTDYLLFFPATAIGFLSVGVLNLNNMRDEISDRNSKKNTIVVRIGQKNARKYHFALIISAMIFVLIFAVFNDFKTYQYLFLIAFFPLTKHLVRVNKTINNKDLDPELKKLALSTFLLSILLAICTSGFLN